MRDLDHIAGIWEAWKGLDSETREWIKFSRKPWSRPRLQEVILDEYENKYNLWLEDQKYDR